MNAAQGIREVVKLLCLERYDPEIKAAKEEMQQREHDFKNADPRFIESTALYWKAACTKYEELLRERKESDATTLVGKAEKQEV